MHNHCEKAQGDVRRRGTGVGATLVRELGSLLAESYGGGPKTLGMTLSAAYGCVVTHWNMFSHLF